MAKKARARQVRVPSISTPTAHVSPPPLPPPHIPHASRGRPSAGNIHEPARRRRGSHCRSSTWPRPPVCHVPMRPVGQIRGGGFLFGRAPALRIPRYRCRCTRYTNLPPACERLNAGFQARNTNKQLPARYARSTQAVRTSSTLPLRQQKVEHLHRAAVHVRHHVRHGSPQVEAHGHAAPPCLHPFPHQAHGAQEPDLLAVELWIYQLLDVLEVMQRKVQAVLDSVGRVQVSPFAPQFRGFTKASHAPPPFTLHDHQLLHTCRSRHQNKWPLPRRPRRNAPVGQGGHAAELKARKHLDHRHMEPSELHQVAL